MGELDLNSKPHGATCCMVARPLHLPLAEIMSLYNSHSSLALFSLSHVWRALCAESSFLVILLIMCSWFGGCVVMWSAGQGSMVLPDGSQHWGLFQEGRAHGSGVFQVSAIAMHTMLSSSKIHNHSQQQRRVPDSRSTRICTAVGQRHTESLHHSTRQAM